MADVQIVWFKRDLRLSDHAPLTRALRAGPTVCLYVYEPEHVESPEFDPSHLGFINESLAELDAELLERGGRLTTRIGAMPDVLEALRKELLASGDRLAGLWSHEETGLHWSFQRDIRVGAWAREQGVAWTEVPQNGVVRRLRGRDGWASRWLSRMREMPLPAPNSDLVWHGLRDHGAIRGTAELGLPDSTKSEVQRGGITAGRDTLRTFLKSRSTDYQRGLSSPNSGAEACSRLSPYLSWGTLSLREVFHATMRRMAMPGAPRESLKSFEGRLRWHCHFIQKLEDEPDLEFQNLNRAYDGLRESEFDDAKFDAWCAGQTGYPMVDACMRSLHATGWINFRMRAMLASFACHHLWLHWRRPAVFLSRHFLDFEPGIHFSQFQMQAGTAGINTFRIYSPAKQLADQDPDGVFTRRWVPELRDVPIEYLSEPHRMSVADQDRYGCVIGRDYPAPIVDHLAASRAAKRRLTSVRVTDDARDEARRVQERHGSRRSPARRNWRGYRR